MLTRLRDAVDAERDGKKKADERSAMREAQLQRADFVDGEPPLTKFARVWGSGSL